MSSISRRPFLVGLLCGASAVVSSSFLATMVVSRRCAMEHCARTTALLSPTGSSMLMSLSSYTGTGDAKSQREKKKQQTPPSLKSYYHLMVDKNGGTSIIEREFRDTEEVGYANAPQVVKELNPDFAKPTNVVFTALEGENPWHFCPAPQIVVCLRGGWYIRTNDGVKTEFREGDVLYQDNVEGHPGAKKEEGDGIEHVGQHFSGSLDGRPCDQTIVQLDLTRGPQVTTPDSKPPL